ncbi:Protocadherin gamma-A5 [Triplophysa tibetana]|uniref:Protocadherin gamma-A5 n=1 Tax=Triplophysa tibetana TaxID=1572043 RepID=A0A5A9NIL5_9TELE|nr:Protocadherin gamma-A5 [Triplophysa tibetana]
MDIGYVATVGHQLIRLSRPRRAPIERTTSRSYPEKPQTDNKSRQRQTMEQKVVRDFLTAASSDFPAEQTSAGHRTECGKRLSTNWVNGWKQDYTPSLVHTGNHFKESHVFTSHKALQSTAKLTVNKGPIRGPSQRPLPLIGLYIQHSTFLQSRQRQTMEQKVVRDFLTAASSDFPAEQTSAGHRTECGKRLSTNWVNGWKQDYTPSLVHTGNHFKESHVFTSHKALQSTAKLTVNKAPIRGPSQRPLPLIGLYIQHSARRADQQGWRPCGEAWDSAAESDSELEKLGAEGLRAFGASWVLLLAFVGQIRGLELSFTAREEQEAGIKIGSLSTNYSALYQLLNENEIYLSIPEDTPIGSAFQLDDQAQYEDAGNNGMILYHLESSVGLFGIRRDGDQLQLMVEKDLDRETLENHHLAVIDECLEPLNAQANLTVTVTDVNDNCPEFDSDSPGTATVPVLGIKGTPLKDIPAGKSFLSLEKDSMIFSLNGGYLLKTSKPLDDETCSKYDVTIDIVVAQGTHLLGREVIKEVVEDVNDNATKFEQASYETTIIENNDHGFFLCRVTVTDADSVVREVGKPDPLQTGVWVNLLVNESLGKCHVKNVPKYLLPTLPSSALSSNKDCGCESNARLLFLCTLGLMLLSVWVLLAAVVVFIKHRGTRRKVDQKSAWGNRLELKPLNRKNQIYILKNKKKQNK